MAIIQTITPEELYDQLAPLRLLEKKVQELEKRAAPTEYLTIKEVANLIRVSQVTVHEYTKRGILTKYVINGSTVRYKRHEVEAALQQIRAPRR